MAEMTTTERPQLITPADWVRGSEQGHWTYQHYAALPDDGQRYEIIDRAARCAGRNEGWTRADYPSHIIGAPNLVVEVSLPSVAGYDRRTKQDTYARAGIFEYWVVDPLAHTIQVEKFFV